MKRYRIIVNGRHYNGVYRTPADAVFGGMRKDDLRFAPDAPLTTVRCIEYGSKRVRTTGCEFVGGPVSLNSRVPVGTCYSQTNDSDPPGEACGLTRYHDGPHRWEVE